MSNLKERPIQQKICWGWGPQDGISGCVRRGREPSGILSHAALPGMSLLCYGVARKLLPDAQQQLLPCSCTFHFYVFPSLKYQITEEDGIEFTFPRFVFLYPMLESACSSSLFAVTTSLFSHLSLHWPNIDTESNLRCLSIDKHRT